MRPFHVMLLSCIGLLIGFGILIGCGSSGDLLDVTGTQYSAYASPQDNGKETSEIDVWQDDCNGTIEDFSPFQAQVIITSESTAADFYVESYDVNFRRNEGTYCEANSSGIDCTWEDLFAAELPPLTGTVLNPRHYNYSSPIISAGGSVTLSGMLIWTQGDKVYYADTVLNVAPLDGSYISSIDGLTKLERWYADFTYDMQIVLHCKTVENEDFTITTPWTPVHFSDFDNC